MLAGKLKSLSGVLTTLLKSYSADKKMLISGTAGELRKSVDEIEYSSRASAVSFFRFTPHDGERRELGFKVSQVVCNPIYGGRMGRRELLGVHFPAGDTGHVKRWASAIRRETFDKKYKLEDVQNLPQHVQLFGASSYWNRAGRIPAQEPTYVRSRALQEPLPSGTAQNGAATPERQRLLTVRHGLLGIKETVVCVDEETFLRVQASSECLQKVAGKNGGPLVLLPDKPFASLTETDLETLKKGTGVSDIYYPGDDISTTHKQGLGSRHSDGYSEIIVDNRGNPEGPWWERYGDDVGNWVEDDPKLRRPT